MKNAVPQSISFPVELVERLNAYLTTNNKSKSRVVQEAVVLYLAHSAERSDEGNTAEAKRILNAAYGAAARGVEFDD